jgi:hypothetical protein
MYACNDDDRPFIVLTETKLITLVDKKSLCSSTWTIFSHYGECFFFFSGDATGSKVVDKKSDKQQQKRWLTKKKGG